MSIILMHTPQVDETYIGGQKKNKHAKKKLHGKWRKGKIAVIGAKEWETKRVTARVIDQIAQTFTLNLYLRYISFFYKPNIEQ